MCFVDDISRLDGFENEAKSDRFKAFMENYKMCQRMTDDEIVKKLREFYGAVGYSEASERSKDEDEKKLLAGFRYYAAERRIVEVFPYELVLMIRDPECLVTEDNVIDLYAQEILDLRGEHNYYSHVAGRANNDENEAIEEIRGEPVLEIVRPRKKKVIDPIPTTRGIIGQEQYTERKCHIEWLRTFFPIDQYRGILDVSLIYELYCWLTYMPQSFVERFFELDVKSVHVFSLIVLKKMEQKEVAALYGETSGATCKRFDRIIRKLFEKDKRQIKAEREKQWRHWIELKKKNARIKREIAAEEKARKEAQKASMVRTVVLSNKK